MLAVTQQLIDSFGIAVSAAILNFYGGQPNSNTVDNFHYTFNTVTVSLISAFVFLCTDGDNLKKQNQKSEELIFLTDWRSISSGVRTKTLAFASGLSIR